MFDTSVLLCNYYVKIVQLTYLSIYTFWEQLIKKYIYWEQDYLRYTNSIFTFNHKVNSRYYILILQFSNNINVALQINYFIFYLTIIN
jgi:hypothetical protein